MSMTCSAHVGRRGDEHVAEHWLFLTLMASLLSMVLKSGTSAASVLMKMRLRTDSVVTAVELSSWFKHSSTYLLRFWSYQGLRPPQVDPESTFSVRCRHALGFLITEALCWNIRVTELDSMWSLGDLIFLIYCYITTITYSNQFFSYTLWNATRFFFCLGLACLS